MKKIWELQDSRTNNYSSLSGAIITSQPISWGLWSLVDFPKISLEEIEKQVWNSYHNVVYNILSRFNFWVSDSDLLKIINEAYWKQWYRDDITPVKQIWNENLYSLHLGYGPTFAFKNIALEFLPRLLSQLTKWKIINVLWASSGDTINAAHSWVKWTNIRSIFMLPNTWPSVIQRLQATNGIANNKNAITLLADAPFDPLQDIVKKINSVEFVDFKQEHNITSFNSINIARILAQTVYYFRAYMKLLENNKINNWEEVVFSVPSWNFWDALACYYAKKMWLPIKKILVATNENNMLDKFFKTWIYEPPKEKWEDFVQVTNSPSMDIAKSSNFERMLFDIFSFDYIKIENFYSTLGKIGKFQVSQEDLYKIQEIFISSSSTDNERLEVISNFWIKYNHWIDPHTAAWVVPWIRWDYNLRWSTPLIFLETSHVAQFWDELKKAWITTPWMNEFDEILNKMRKINPVEWKDYIKISWKFEDTFEAIKKAIEILK